MWNHNGTEPSALGWGYHFTRALEATGKMSFNEVAKCTERSFSAASSLESAQVLPTACSVRMDSDTRLLEGGGSPGNKGSEL